MNVATLGIRTKHDKNFTVKAHLSLLMSLIWFDRKSLKWQWFRTLSLVATKRRKKKVSVALFDEKPQMNVSILP